MGLQLFIVELIRLGWLENDFTISDTQLTFSLDTVGNTTRSAPSSQSFMPITPNIIICYENH